MSELIPVTKEGDYIEVHPYTLAEHEALGWVKCQRREVPVAKPARKPKG